MTIVIYYFCHSGYEIYLHEVINLISQILTKTL